MRQMGKDIPLEDDIIIISDSDPVFEMEQQEQAKRVKQAILMLQHPDREIFLRHYYYYQSVAEISEEMDINISTVKTRLRRGRNKLKELLCQGGYSDEKENI